jgi:hypothetical protein
MAIWITLALSLLLVVVGWVGTVISLRFYQAWGVPRDHWAPWYVSVASFALLGFAIQFSGIVRDWRYEQVERVEGLVIAGVILLGHLVAYFIVKARGQSQPPEADT